MAEGCGPLQAVMRHCWPSSDIKWPICKIAKYSKSNVGHIWLRCGDLGKV